MDLCEFCYDLAGWISSPHYADLPDTRYVDVCSGYKRRVFKKPMHITCELCAALIDTMNLNEDERKTTLSLEILVWRSELRSGKGLYCFCTVGQHVKPALSANPGTPASDVFVTQSPICSGRMEEAGELTQSWINECASHHNCLAAAPEALPKRLLQITGSMDTLLVRLVESHGKTGTYCALSHCWGPKDKQPLRTMRDNYKQHTDGIGLEALPKTFQDFILLARSIGIGYVWIDSLCIVQDDEQDWASQAEAMESAYRNATLVVAAAGARHPMQGLFITDRPHTRIWSVPFGQTGSRGVFNISVLPKETRKRVPWDCPLGSRGWVLQEWYLARRILFCMPLGLSWQCDGIYTVEGGSRVSLGHKEKRSWDQLLRSYTTRSLTYPSDRLHALRGIVTHLQRNREDKFLHNYGIWEDNLHQQLLWSQLAPSIDTESLPLPTWSWAATGGAKQWTNSIQLEMLDLKPMTRRLHICDSGAMCSAGYLATSALIIDPVTSYTARILWRLRSYAYVEELEFTVMLSINKAEILAYIARDLSKSQPALGIIVFDSEPLSPVSYFFVGRIPRPSRDFSRWQITQSESKGQIKDGQEKCMVDVGAIHRNELSPRSGAGDEYEKAPLPIPPPSRESRYLNITIRPNFRPLPGSTDERSDQADELAELMETTPFVYFCLLLDSVGEGKYKRVGMALLYPHAFEAMKPAMTEFEIV